MVESAFPMEDLGATPTSESLSRTYTEHGWSAWCDRMNFIEVRLEVCGAVTALYWDWLKWDEEISAAECAA